MAYRKGDLVFDDVTRRVVGICNMDGTVTAVPAFIGAVGQRYGIVAGVIRNAGASEYWQPLEDSGHNVSNIDSVSTSTVTITIDYTSLGATKVVSFIAAPDETLVENGFIVGASVGTEQAALSIQRGARTIEDYISWNGSAFTSLQSKFTITSYTTGVLTLGHDSIDGQGCCVTPRGGVYDAVVSSAGSAVATTSTKIEFWSRAAGTLATVGATDMKCFVSRTRQPAVMNPQTVDTTAYPNSNIWVLGIFEV